MQTNSPTSAMAPAQAAGAPMGNQPEQTRTMVDPAGKSYNIPFSKVEDAHNDGLEFTTSMSTPDGKQTFNIPQSQVSSATQDGLKPLDNQVVTPFEQKLASDTQYANSTQGAFNNAAGSAQEKMVEGAVGLVSPTAQTWLSNFDKKNGAQRYDQLVTNPNQHSVASTLGTAVGGGATGVAAAGLLPTTAGDSAIAGARSLWGSLGNAAKAFNANPIVQGVGKVAKVAGWGGLGVNGIEHAYRWITGSQGE